MNKLIRERIAAEERCRIGQELHDVTQQELIGVGLMAQNLVHLLEKGQQRRIPGQPTSESLDPEFKRIALAISQQADVAVQHVRALSRGLIPAQVDSRDLVESMADLARRAGELIAHGSQARNGHRGVKCRFECPEAFEVPDDVVATHLYRIAQEGLTNALTHSHADRIQLKLTRIDDVISLEVLDNGIGIDEEQYRNKESRGLMIMADRARLINATLTINRPANGGTLLTCTLSCACCATSSGMRSHRTSQQKIDRSSEVSNGHK